MATNCDREEIVRKISELKPQIYAHIVLGSVQDRDVVTSLFLVQIQ